MGTCPLRVDVGRGKEAPPFRVLKRGRDLKSKQTSQHPMTTMATTGCTTAEQEQEHRDTGAEWRGHRAQGHADS